MKLRTPITSDTRTTVIEYQTLSMYLIQTYAKLFIIKIRIDFSSRLSIPTQHFLKTVHTVFYTFNASLLNAFKGQKTRF